MGRARVNSKIIRTTLRILNVTVKKGRIRNNNTSQQQQQRALTHMCVMAYTQLLDTCSSKCTNYYVCVCVCVKSAIANCGVVSL